MKLSASNLAWSPQADEAAFATLLEHGFAGIEVAPTRIADWGDLTDASLAAFRARCHAAGLVISSLQAIFYARPHVQLLGDADAFAAMCHHMACVGRVAARLGAGIAVLGAPRNRLRGAIPLHVADRLAAERLRILGDIAGKAGLILALEPVPPVYGADFLIRFEQVIEMVERSDHPNIRAHVDCACLMLGGDDTAQAIVKHAGQVAHYHAAEPDLGPFTTPGCDHEAAASALRQIGYSGWIAVEMRQQGEDGLLALREALKTVGRIYGEA